MNAGLDRRLKRIEAHIEARGPDLALLLREALAAHGREAVVAVCERVGVDLATAERWAAESLGKAAFTRSAGSCERTL